MIVLDPRAYRKISLADTQDGDIFVQLANPRTIYGRLAIRFGISDATRKGVPVCQHTLMRTTKRGKPHKLEAVVLISENLIQPVEGDCYLVLRHPKLHPGLVAAAIEFGRLRIGELYGVKNLAIIAAKLMLPWAPFRGNDNDNPFCALMNADQFDHVGLPLKGDGDEDWSIAPWDFLTPAILDQFNVVGRLGSMEQALIPTPSGMIYARL